MSKQVCLPKIRLILQKYKNWPKSDICSFYMKSFNYVDCIADQIYYTVIDWEQANFIVTLHCSENKHVHFLINKEYKLCKGLIRI